MDLDRSEDGVTGVVEKAKYEVLVEVVDGASEMVARVMIAVAKKQMLVPHIKTRRLTEGWSRYRRREAKNPSQQKIKLSVERIM